MLGRLLVRFLAFGLLFWFIGRAIRRFLGGIRDGMAPPGRPPNKAAGTGQLMARDPVCGTFVEPERAISVRDRSGTHYFSSEKCRQAFESRT